MTTQLLLNIPEARKARDAGIEKARKSTEAATPGWEKLAYEKLKEFLKIHSLPFLAEEVRSFAAVDDNFPLPEHSRAWGGVMRKAAFDGLIKKIGIQATCNPKAHMANAALWQRQKINYEK